MNGWMIYGANGYTGRLAAEEAARRGWKPVVAGRSEAVRALGQQLGLEARVFGLDDPAKVAAALAGMKAVLHCAGPFSKTSAPMLDGCLAAGAHYLDITGEIAVFEAIHARTNELAKRGVTAVPGVGFDVVPTDCLAAMLHRALPGATSLRMGMMSVGGGISQGTAKTALEGLPQGGAVRRGGKIVSVPAAHKSAMIPFSDKKLTYAVAIPWGDVSTAYHSTGIPDIEFYAAVPPSVGRLMRLTGKVPGLFRPKFVQGALRRLVEWRVKGPDERTRASGESRLWGEARDAQGRTVAMRMRTPQGYALTVEAALASVARVLEGHVGVGALTPSKAFGADFVLTLPGVRVETVA